MNQEEPQSPGSGPSPIEDGSSLGYGQGLDYQYLSNTQSFKFRLPPREKRLRELRARRLQRQQGSQSSGGRIRKVAASASMSVGQAALILSGSIVASRFLGLLRSSLFTGVIGANAFSDAFQQASLIPDLIFNIVAGGALASAFIPIFNMYMVRRDEKTAWHVASSAINLAIVCMVLLAIIGFIFARQIVFLYGYTDSANQIDLVVLLTRIMFLQSIIMGSGVVVTSVLNTRQHFLLPAIGSVLYPLGAIAGLFPGLMMNLLGHSDKTLAIACASWGVVLGAVFMVGIQLPGLAKVGMQYHFSLDWRHPGIGQIVRLMLPRMLNALVLNFSSAIDFMLIGLLVIVAGSDGLVTQYRLAFTIMSIPLSGVISLATAAFPRMSEYAAQGRITDLRNIVQESLHSILFIAIPSGIGLICLSLPIVQVLYERNTFTLSQAQATTLPLICFAIGLPGLAMAEILTRSFYALRQSKLPVFVSVGQFIFKIALSIVLLNPAVWCVQIGLGSLTPSALSQPLLAGAWGLGSLALATSIAVLLEAAVLLWLLRLQIVSLGLRTLLSFVVRVLLASILMSLGIVITYRLLNMVVTTESSNGSMSLSIVGSGMVLLKLLITVGIGSWIYLRAARFLKILSVKELGPVNRLLIRLHLAWI
ncbi:murein biosynthesis integral membrane protein MurJ [Ktedonosporobacter rubrisoli]|uniref:Probable lipid II flippase MurJ n=1 Tax=Ktedonosporobacter rubrisoli TaxID=2509675 RepID=A0A4P6JRU1_KTERU|nr:murein biosynthesis integral membrane protein MurJ [Ktedonosporobacter rubrisoli]QBD78025.1 murein biosynthesis integral membrane protein MurJ [Ktedonosporobacter rubrisoli]